MILMKKINEARKKLPSLQQTNNIEFCEVQNDNLIAYVKYDDQKNCLSLMIASLDSYYTQQGSVKLPLKQLGLESYHNFSVEDVITGNQYNWNSDWNYVALHPALPFHLFKISL
jgi:starch synthase (maltosyl-transferring)